MFTTTLCPIIEVYREGPKIILYSIGISHTLAQANQEQAKQALTVVVIIPLAPS